MELLLPDFQGQSKLLFTSVCYAASWLLPHDLLSLLSFTIQYLLPRGGTTPSGTGTININHYTIQKHPLSSVTASSDLGPPTLTINQEDAPQTCLPTIFFFFLFLFENCPIYFDHNFPSLIFSQTLPTIPQFSDCSENKQKNRKQNLKQWKSIRNTQIQKN